MCCVIGCQKMCLYDLYWLIWILERNKYCSTCLIIYFSFDPETAKLSSNVSDEWYLPSSAYNTRNSFTWVQDLYWTAWHSDVVFICQVWRGWQFATSKTISKSKIPLLLSFHYILNSDLILLFVLTNFNTLSFYRKQLTKLKHSFQISVSNIHC